MTEEILKNIENMLNIPKNNGEDVEIGSFYYDTAAMYALEEDYLKKYAVDISKNIFIHSCNEDILPIIGEQMGLPIILENYATGKIKLSGPKDLEIPQGTEISSSISGVKYITEETEVLEATPIEVKIICTEIGSVGNQEVNVLDTCSINEVQVNQDKIIMTGTNAETLEEYRERLIDFMKKPKRNGNASNICQWAEEFLGVGKARCIANWKGAGTLKLLALDDKFNVISESKRQELHDYIEDKISDFAELTTEIPTENSINIEINCTLAFDYTVEILKNELFEIIDNYFKELSFNSDNLVSIMDLISLVNTATGIKYLKNVTMNNKNADAVLENYEIPKVGIITITEV